MRPICSACDVDGGVVDAFWLGSLPNPKAARRAARPGEGFRTCLGLRSCSRSGVDGVESSDCKFELEIYSDRGRRNVSDRDSASRSAVIGVDLSNLTLREIH
jgi:hypothetical protein